jgi:hypothetical protein
MVAGNSGFAKQSKKIHKGARAQPAIQPAASLPSSLHVASQPVSQPNSRHPAASQLPTSHRQPASSKNAEFPRLKCVLKHAASLSYDQQEKQITLGPKMTTRRSAASGEVYK